MRVLLHVCALVATVSALCSNTCSDFVGEMSSSYASNGVCQDGGPGSTGSPTCYQGFGSDCADCGPRLAPPSPPSPPTPPPPPFECQNHCTVEACEDIDCGTVSAASNGICQDGGPGAEGSPSCMEGLGSDCADCERATSYHRTRTSLLVDSAIESRSSILMSLIFSVILKV